MGCRTVGRNGEKGAAFLCNTASAAGAVRRRSRLRAVRRAAPAPRRRRPPPSRCEIARPTAPRSADSTSPAARDRVLVALDLQRDLADGVAGRTNQPPEQGTPESATLPENDRMVRRRRRGGHRPRLNTTSSRRTPAGNAAHAGGVARMRTPIRQMCLSAAVASIVLRYAAR